MISCVLQLPIAFAAWSNRQHRRMKFNNDKRPRWIHTMMIKIITMSSKEFVFLEMAL
jgi:hypothetical protein